MRAKVLFPFSAESNGRSYVILRSIFHNLAYLRPIQSMHQTMIDQFSLHRRPFSDELAHAQNTLRDNPLSA